MADREFLKALTEVPSVGTACLPMYRLLEARLGADFALKYVSDGYGLFTKHGAAFAALKVLFVAHVDEVGGCVYGPYAEGGYLTRWWGNGPEVFADTALQAFDYLAEDGSTAFPITGDVVNVGGEYRLMVQGEGIRPYRTVFTFREETIFDGDTIEGKALDPRVTVYAVAEAARAMNSPYVGVLFVMAEECAMDVARKAVHFLAKAAPALELIVNADVPALQNIGEGQTTLPAIRVFEGRNFIDPAFGIRTADLMEKKGVAFHLSAAKSGSQTLLFTPLAPTLSIALPSDGIHVPRYKMSLTGADRCVTLLTVLAEAALNGELSGTFAGY